MVTSAKSLIEEARKPAAHFALVLLRIVDKELEGRLSEVHSDILSKLRDARRTVMFAQICEDVLHGKVNTHEQNLSMDSAANALTELVEDFREVALPVPWNKEIYNAAYGRSLLGQAPAQRGKKDSVADCGIAESLLALAKHLPQARQRIIFLTSNKSDFDQPSLKEEFQQVGIQYCTKWSHARHLVLRGESAETT